MICLDGHVDLFLIFVEGSFGFQQSCPAADRGVRNKKNGAAHVSEEQLSGKWVKGAAIGLGSLWGSRKWHSEAAVRALGCVQPLGKRQEKRLFSMSRLLGFMAWFQGISWRQRKWQGGNISDKMPPKVCYVGQSLLTCHGCTLMQFLLKCPGGFLTLQRSDSHETQQKALRYQEQVNGFLPGSVGDWGWGGGATPLNRLNCVLKLLSCA